MIRIDKDTVELTSLELRAGGRWNKLLDDGWGIAEATRQVAGEYPELDAEFIDYLNGIDR